MTNKLKGEFLQVFVKTGDGAWPKNGQKVLFFLDLYFFFLRTFFTVWNDLTLFIWLFSNGFIACAYDSRATLIRTVHILKNIESKNVESKNVECLLDVRDVIEGMLGRDNDQSVVKIPELEHLVSISNNSFLSALEKSWIVLKLIQCKNCSIIKQVHWVPGVY